MSDYRVARANAGGGVALTQLLGDRSLEEYEQKAAEVGGVVVKVEDLPSSEDRPHWVLDGKKVVVSAESIANEMKTNIRHIRDAKLQALDIPSMRALEDGDVEKSQEIKAKKQMLRDLPEKVEADLDKIVKNSRKRTTTKIKDLNKYHLEELED